MRILQVAQLLFVSQGLQSWSPGKEKSYYTSHNLIIIESGACIVLDADAAQNKARSRCAKAPETPPEMFSQGLDRGRRAVHTDTSVEINNCVKSFIRM